MFLGQWPPRSRGLRSWVSWVVASAVEGLKVGDIIDISETFEWTLEGCGARAHERGVRCGCCRLLSKIRAGSDTFKHRVKQECANPLSPSKAEVAVEVDDARALWVEQTGFEVEGVRGRHV